MYTAHIFLDRMSRLEEVNVYGGVFFLLLRCTESINRATIPRHSEEQLSGLSIGTLRSS